MEDHIISEHKLLSDGSASGFAKYHEWLLASHLPPDLLIVDATHIRSLHGSEALASGYKAHGKKAIKLTRLTVPNKVIYMHDIHTDNLPDGLAFKVMAINSPSAKFASLTLFNLLTNLRK